MEPDTRYARSGDLQIAYQVLGDGPIDVLFVPIFASSIDAAWGIPDIARFFRRIASFSRLILFDRRGSGMSDGTRGTGTLEEQIDDVRAVLDLVGAPRPALLSMIEGCALSALFAASHPASVRALVMMTPTPRLVSGPGYEWAHSVEERAAFIDRLVAFWGSESPGNPWISNLEIKDEPSRRAFARTQRMSMSPGFAAAAQANAGDVDVRQALPSIQCPTLVLRRAGETTIDARHSRYVAEHVPGARYVELSGDGPVFLGDVEESADEIEQFLTGSRRPPATDRVLATVLFTDIVGSTEHAAALGDGPWRSLLERHDDVVHDEVARHRGHVVKSLGDGALAVFDGPSRAISSAVAIRERTAALGIEVRAGLHTGECELLPDQDVGGIAVHIAARVSALAGPGEVLVSSTVRDLAVGSGHVLTDRGEHDLKGVPGPWRLFAVTV